MRIDEEILAAIRRAMPDAVTYEDVDWDLIRPCADCPFRKSSPYHEGVAASVPHHCGEIAAGRFAHTCHKTDGRSDSEEGRRYRGRPKHCAGALFMLIRSPRGTDLQRPLLRAVGEGKVDIAELTRRARAEQDVYTLREFVAFYAAELSRRIDRGEAES